MPDPKRVAIIGGGAAGMACAWSLSRFPDKFDVDVWEALPNTGGVATTSKVGEGMELNDQVQGGAPSYRNNLLFFKEFGFEPHQVDLRIAFGVGGSAWTNHSDSELVRRLQPDIERFGRALKWVHRLEMVFLFVPICKVLSWWGFSDEFSYEMVFPLTALFFGTGNQTPYVSAAVVARVFLDPQLRLFQYSPKRLLDEVPSMFAFPKLGEVFGTIAAKINATIRTSARVDKVVRSGGKVCVTDTAGITVEYEEVVFACGAEEALRMLDAPSWMERRLLPRVEYFDDLIVTHKDEAYMRSHYTFIPEHKDMYFVRTNPEDRSQIEMSFDLSAYQPHLSDQASVFQSIFLDRAQEQHWTVGAIDSTKILKQRWTRQFAHTYRHFSKWVPWVRFLQGEQHTWYCGSYTLINTHEIAVMSGLAVAERLGAPYPFGHDDLATQQFDMYLKLAHGLFVRRRRAC